MLKKHTCADEIALLYLESYVDFDKNKLKVFDNFFGESMSKKAVVQLYKNESFKEEVSATTKIDEIVRVGGRYGYQFTREELKEVLQKVTDFQTRITREKSVNSTQDCQHKIKLINGQTNNVLDLSGLSSSQTSLCLFTDCYEFNLNEIQGFENLTTELEKIKIKPDSVDISVFEKTFRQDDFNFASISPDSADFRIQYEEIININNNFNSDRSFHLIDLDNHLDHQLYEDYFQAKVRIIRILKNFFEADVKLTGSFWYPPNAYRTWHTNENAVGWRMYLIDFDQPELAADGQSFFRYIHPETKELITLVDKPKLVRFFKIENQPEQLFWHCIVNATKANRWSYGFHVPDNWIDKIK